MESTNITGKIVGYRLATVQEVAEAAVQEPVGLHEGVTRPSELSGTTYVLSPPSHVSKHSLYITINDIVLPDGYVAPYELFIASKDTSNFQWQVTIALLISAIFRKGGDVNFIVKQLQVSDPNGGYWSGGKFYPSLISEIGAVVAKHLAKVDKANSRKTTPISIDPISGDVDGALVNTESSSNTGIRCPDCNQPTLVVSEGCCNCLSCGYSKCG